MVSCLVRKSLNPGTKAPKANEVQQARGGGGGNRSPAQNWGRQGFGQGFGGNPLGGWGFGWGK